ncbi:MAG: hypothetical protein NTZ02_03955 [Candidatus Woesearchaeota archaeon]|nr:hypothetical protein [Candidatus Woesearchaeota archaeon]
MNTEKIGEFLKPTEKAIQIFIPLLAFFSLWLFAARFPVYFFIAFAAFIYIYACDLSRRMQLGRIKSAGQLALDLSLKMLAFFMAMLLIYTLGKI